MNTKILIRCDVGYEVGYGHIVRCLALAAVLKAEYDCEVTFAMLSSTDSVAKIQKEGHRVIQKDSDKDSMDEAWWLERIALDLQPRALILDVRTGLKGKDLLSIRERGVVVVSIDDPSDRKFFSDLFFAPPVPQLKNMDRNLFSGDCYIGWEWVLLRPQFAMTKRRQVLKSAKIDGRSEQTLLISMGGSDPKGLTLTALEAVERLGIELRTIVVLGGGFMHHEKLKSFLKMTEKNYQIQSEVNDIAQLMAAADIAVASFGVTAYELAAVGTPALYLCLSPDDQQSAFALEIAGFGKIVGLADSVSRIHLSKIIEERLISTSKYDLQHKLLMDGLGATRIASKIMSKIER